MNHEKIVIGCDGSPGARRAVRWALDEAARTHVPVELCCSAGSTGPKGQRAMEDILEDAALDAAATHPAVVVGTVLSTRSAVETLVRRSAAAGLVVLGSRGSSRCGGPLGSVSAVVSRDALCPVIVIRDRPAYLAPVVAGVDGSAIAGTVLTYAFEQAAARRVALRVIRVIQPARAGENRRSTLEEWRTLADLVERRQLDFPGVKATHEVMVGHPAVTLLDAAMPAQLMVVGTRGSRAFRGGLLASVSRHLIRHAETSVAVVHDTYADLAPTGH